MSAPRNRTAVTRYSGFSHYESTPLTAGEVGPPVSSGNLEPRSDLRREGLSAPAASGAFWCDFWRGFVFGARRGVVVFWPGLALATAVLLLRGAVS